MALLPDPTVDAIYRHYQATAAAEPRRKYLGGSRIGAECRRQLWYEFRWVGQECLDGRLARLFQTGHREEARIIADLRSIGYTVYDRAPDGNQWRFTACDGHLSGGLDGVIVGLLEAPKTPHLLECKTHNKKSFEKLVKEAVEKAKPEHAAQMQMYMGLAELTRAAYVAECKDDDSLYLERLEFSAKTYKALLLKAEGVIKAETPPPGTESFACKWCAFKEHCQGSKVADTNCRTCVHSSPVAGGEWACSQGLEMGAQCDQHILIPDLVPFAEPQDGDPGHIVYRRKSDGLLFVNCARDAFPALDMPHYLSRELSAVEPEAIGVPEVEAARTILAGEVVAA